MVILFVLVFCSPLRAMQLDANTIAEITTDPNHQVNGYGGGFAVSGNVAVWIDGRDPVWIPRVYGVNLDDPLHQEFLIDVNASNASRLAMSGPIVCYIVQLPDGPQFVRVDDISNQSNPRILCEFFPRIEYVDYLDVWGKVVAYCGDDANNEYRETVYAADITDANNVRQYTISVLPSGDYVSGLAIDGNRIVWSANYWEPNVYVQVADINDLNDPNVATAFLAGKTTFETVDASGDWLVAHGRSDYQGRVFAVHNYRDVNEWDVLTLWREGENGENFVSGPRIDGPIAVWVTSTRQPSFGGQPGPLQQEYEYFLKGAYLTGNGGYSVSTLIRDANEIDAADISYSQVVWSQMHDDVMDLYKGSIKLQCGDWGYKSGDLDRNCKVNFYDFAVFAEDWLGCTMPDDPNCGYGSFR